MLEKSTRKTEDKTKLKCYMKCTPEWSVVFQQFNKLSNLSPKTTDHRHLFSLKPRPQSLRIKKGGCLKIPSVVSCFELLM